MAFLYCGCSGLSHPPRPGLPLSLGHLLLCKGSLPHEVITQTKSARSPSPPPPHLITPSRVWTPLYVYAILDLSVRVLAQQSFLREEITPWLRNVLGLHHYSQVDLSYQGFGIVLEWVAASTFVWAVRTPFEWTPCSSPSLSP